MQVLVNDLIKPIEVTNINTLKGIKNLIILMNKRGFTVCNVKTQGYFYTSVEGDDLEVCVDSRANLRPRNRIEGLIMACLKVYISQEQHWVQLAESVGLNYKELIIKAQKSGNKIYVK